MSMLLLLASLVALATVQGTTVPVAIQLPGTDRRVLDLPLQSAFGPVSPISDGINVGKVCNIDPGSVTACFSLPVDESGNKMCGDPFPVPRSRIYVRTEQNYMQYLWQTTIDQNDFPDFEEICSKGQGLTFSAICNNVDDVTFMYVGPITCDRS